jgi:hypothetical protein
MKNKPSKKPRIGCKKCKGTGMVVVSKALKYRGHLLIGAVSMRCDHKDLE